MDKLAFESGALVDTGRGVAILHDQLMGNNRMALVVQFIRNVGNNRPDLIEVDSEMEWSVLGLDEWRLATAEEVRESVEKRRAALNAKLDAVLQSLTLPLDTACE